MPIKDAALNIATLGYRSYQENLKLKSELETLRSKSSQGGAKGSTDIGGVRVVDTTGQSPNNPHGGRPLRPANPKTLRLWVDSSVWVRAAFDIYRDMVAMAEPVVTQADRELGYDKGVKREVEQLLSQPNERGEPYSELKEQMIEDYLALGMGALRKTIRRDLTPIALYILDTANFGIFSSWDGNPAKPHYATVDPATGQQLEVLADAEAMVLTNRKRSYDPLGFSHVEALAKTVAALIEGDEFLKNQVLNSAPKGLLNLGEGLTQPQIDEARSRIQNTRYPFVITGGVKNPSYTALSLTPQQLQVLDAQIWFVRQVAAIFKIPTAMLQLAVDTSRANTEAMLTNAEAVGLVNLLKRIMKLENAELLLRYGPVTKYNLKIDYPILSARDATTQANISKIYIGNQPFATPNEVRASNGLPALEEPIYDQILWQDGKNGPIPLMAIQQRYYGDTGNLKESEPPAEEVPPDQGPATEEEDPATLVTGEQEEEKS